MKKAILQPNERACLACDGKGVEPAKLPARPGVKVYPPRCKECHGNGRTAGWGTPVTSASRPYGSL